MPAIRTVTTTTSPIAEKSERGSVRPGSRASSARLATVSSPVYASIASGSANARSPQSWPVAKPRPSESVSGESRNASAENDEEPLDDEVEQRNAERADVEPRSPGEPHGRDRRDQRRSRSIASHGSSRSDGAEIAAAR